MTLPCSRHSRYRINSLSCRYTAVLEREGESALRRRGKINTVLSCTAMLSSNGVQMRKKVLSWRLDEVHSTSLLLRRCEWEDSNRLALIPALPRDHKAKSAQGRPTTDSSRASMPPTSRTTPSALAAPTSSLRCSSSEAPAIIATSHEFCHG